MSSRRSRSVRSRSPGPASVRESDADSAAPGMVTEDRRRGYWACVVFGLAALIWLPTLMRQAIYGDVQRWALFLVPDRIVSGWFDGPVSMSGGVQRLLVLLGAAVVVMAAAACGWWLTAALVAKGQTRAGRGEPIAGWRRREHVAVWILLGLAIQSTATLGVGLVGGLGSGWSFVWILLLSGGLTVGLGGLLRRAFAVRDAEGESGQHEVVQHEVNPEEEKAGSKLAGWLTVAMGVMLMAHAMLPPTEYDVREYHLQAPKEWWGEGAISFMPHNIYANMPMGAEMHTLVGMSVWECVGEDAWWWGALIGKLVLAGFVILAGVLTGGLVRRVVRRAVVRECRGGSENAGARENAGESEAVGRERQRLANWCGDWTTLILVTSPALLEGGSLGLVEPALAAYFAGALFCLWVARECAERCLPLAAGWVALACLLGGATVAVKYPAVVLVLPVLLGMLWWVGVRWGDRERKGALLRRPAWWGVWLGFAGVGGALWYVKNVWLCGNPVYPLAGTWFGGSTLTPEKIAQWKAGHVPPGYSAAAVWESLRTMLWQWRLQGWLMLPLLIAGVVRGWRVPAVRLYGVGLAYAVVVWWMATHRIARFLIPMLPLAGVCAGFGILAVRETLAARGSRVVLSGLVLLNMIYAMSATMGDTRIGVELSYLRVDDRSGSELSRLPGHVPWVNAELPAGSRLLVVGDAAVFDYEVPLAYSTTFDTSPLVMLTTGPEAGWPEAFQQAGFTHLLMHWGEIARLRSTYGFDPRIDRELITRMRRAGVLSEPPTVLSDGAIEVYRLEPTDSNEAVAND